MKPIPERRRRKIRAWLVGGLSVSQVQAEAQKAGWTVGRATVSALRAEVAALGVLDAGKAARKGTGKAAARPGRAAPGKAAKGRRGKASPPAEADVLEDVAPLAALESLARDLASESDPSCQIGAARCLISAAKVRFRGRGRTGRYGVVTVDLTDDGELGKVIKAALRGGSGAPAGAAERSPGDLLREAVMLLRRARPLASSARLLTEAAALESRALALLGDAERQGDEGPRGAVLVLPTKDEAP